MYLELRSTPKVFSDSITKEVVSSMDDYIQLVLKAIREGEEEFDGKIRVRYLASINRFGPVVQGDQIVDLALKYKDDHHLVGVELSGDPRAGDFEAFKPALTRAKEGGLKVSLHCAEVPEQAKETLAMIEFKPDRLGHCIYMVWY